MTTQTLNANVTDTNHKPRGAMTIEIEFLAGRPCEVRHDGLTYRTTGKDGHHIASGIATIEMATDDDTRLWISHDGSQIWED